MIRFSLTRITSAAMLVFCVAILLSGRVQAQGFSGLQPATVPLTGIENVPMDQGAGCNSHTAPCQTLQAPSARLGQPVTAASGCPASISAPFSYQECFDTSGSLPVLRQWFHGSWNPVYTIDTSTGIMTPPVGGGTATIASNGTTDLCSSPQAAVTISGTTTITGFGTTCQPGVIKLVNFSGALTLTYNATSLIIPGAANVTTAAGDTMIAEPTGSGNWIVLFYQPASGGPIGLTRAQVIAALGYTPANQASPTFSGTVTFPDGSAWSSSGLTPSGRPIGYAALATVVLPHVANNSLLGLASTATYPSGVIRDDYLVGNGAPPVLFKPLTGTCAANGLVSDGGSCRDETSGDGNAWAAKYGAAGADVREWGAACNGSTNDSAAIIAAIAAATTAKIGAILMPPLTCYTTAQIIVTPNVLLVGSVFAPSDPPAGSILECASTVANACLVVSGDSAGDGIGNSSAGVRNLTVEYSGTPPTNSDNIEILGGNNPVLDHLFAYNGYNGFAFVGTCQIPPSTGCSYGISDDNDYLYTGAIANDHFYISNWAEAKFSHVRAGMIGNGDLAANAYVFVTGGNGGGAQGPLAIYFSQSVFSQGTSAPTYFWQFSAMASIGTDFRLNQVRVEDTGTGALFATDSATPALSFFEIGDSAFQTPSRPAFAINAATQSTVWQIHDDSFQCTTFALAGGTNPMGSILIAGTQIICPAHFTSSSAGGDSLSLNDDFYSGNLTIDGSGQWNSLAIDGGAFISGVLVNNTITTSNLSIDLPGTQGQMNCGVGATSPLTVQFGGAATGITYSKQSCTWSITNNVVKMSFDLVMSSNGAATGTATLANLPTSASGAAYGNGGTCMPFVANLSSLTGTVLISTGAGTAVGNIVQSSSTGFSNLADTNFTSTSQLTCTLVYQVQ